MKIFAENFRGFRFVSVDIGRINFILGDNSSGKSSLLHLISAVTRHDLEYAPILDEDFGVSQFDYFSPYFSNADVVFGFSIRDDDGDFIKLITVSRNSEGFAEIRRCSYISHGKCVTLRTQKGNLQYRVLNQVDDFSWENASHIHKSNLGFKKSEQKAFTNLGSPALLFAVIDYKALGLKDLVNGIMGRQLPSSQLLSPTRALPEKFYTYQRKINAQGKHFAAMWMDFVKDKSESSASDISAFGLESGLFQDLQVKRISNNVAESPLIVTVKKSGRFFTINQVGIGVSQVVPVLMETMYCLNSGSVILAQQPELHLHPIAQAALGSYIFRSTQRGLRGAFETHSSYLLDRFRAELRDQQKQTESLSEDQQSNQKNEKRLVSAEDCKILFCTNSDDGNSVTEISLLPDGTLENDPPQFHEFFISELVRTMF